MSSPDGRHASPAEGLATRWNVSPAEGIEIQRRLRPLVRRSWNGRAIRLVAGADVHFPARGAVRAAIVVLSYPALEIVDRSVFEGPCAFPYVPGLLSFREIPPLLEALRALRAAPDCVLCDGQGVAHPRGLGLASHFGLATGIPSIGCAKSPLFGLFAEPGPNRGDESPIEDPAGRRIGSVLRTRDRTRPLYVSIGHLVSLRKAVSIVLSCTGRFRIPEPLRAAHRLAGAGRL